MALLTKQCNADAIVRNETVEKDILESIYYCGLAERIDFVHQMVGQILYIKLSSIL